MKGGITPALTKLIKEATSLNKSLIDHVNDFAEYWAKSKDMDLIKKSAIQPKILITFLDTWYKSQLLRLFYTLGLNNKEIRVLRKNFHDFNIPRLYNQLKQNPYSVYTVDLNKCDEILIRIGVNLKDEIWVARREVGIFVRKMYDYLINKGWVYIPSKVAGSLFPNVPSAFARWNISKIFLKAEMHGLLLKYPYAVELMSSFLESKFVEDSGEPGKLYRFQIRR